MLIKTLIALAVFSTNAQAIESPLPTDYQAIVRRMKNGWAIQNAGKDYSVQRSSDVLRQPETGQSYRFELRKGDVWHYRTDHTEGSFRSEMSTDDYVSISSVQWYGFSFFIPTNFPQEDTRLVIGQWWAKNKKWLDEPGRPPPLCQDYENGRFTIVLRWSADRVVKESDPHRTVLYKSNRLPLGKWNDFIYHVKWSYKNDGFVEVWHNGERILNYRGPVGYNDDIGPTFKFGLYRDESNSTQVIYFDRIRRGHSYSEVDPSSSIRP
jgi:hypothetical protein